MKQTFRATTPAGLLRILATLALTGVIWSVSSVTYYWVLPPLDVDDGYNDAPFVFAAFYGGWVLVTYGAFGHLVPDWPSPPKLRAYIYPAAGLITVLVAYVLLVFPSFQGALDYGSEGPHEPFVVSAAYFLPKTVEILLQQLLIAALVLRLRAEGFALWANALIVAVLFGGFHLTLGLIYSEPGVVAKVTFVATGLGLLAPLLILRVPGGFLFSCAVHWSFYAWLALIFRPH